MSNIIIDNTTLEKNIEDLPEEVRNKIIKLSNRKLNNLYIGKDYKGLNIKTSSQNSEKAVVLTRNKSKKDILLNNRMREDRCMCSSCSVKSGLKTKISNNTFDIIPKGITYGVEIESLLDMDRFKKYHLRESHGEVISIKDLLSSTSVLDSVKFSKEDLSLVNKNFKFGRDCSIQCFNSEKVLKSEARSKILTGDRGLDIVNNFFLILDPKFNSSCGIHVHVGRDGLNNDFKNLCMFRYIIDNIIAPFFMSKERYLNSNYCQRKMLNVHKLNQETIFTEKIDYSDEVVYYEIARMHMHYASCSISSKYRTIEFRHLDGKKDYENVIEFIVLMTNIMNKLPKFKYEEMKNIIKNILTINNSCKIFLSLVDYRTNYQKEAFELAKEFILSKEVI